jgi:hypothetical protein
METKHRHAFRRTPTIITTVGGLAVVVAISYDTRKRRSRKMLELPVLTQDIWKEQYANYRSWSSLVETIQRMGLMGSTRSVRSELQDIRTWHAQHDFKGGIVVRDLTKPVFGFRHDDHPDDDVLEGDSGGWTLQELLQDPTRLERRECYYLYYEIEPTGKIVQQVFCRGTTLAFDVVTCLQAWMVYDQELKCSVHRGFLNQANRILEDISPLIVPPGDRRAAVEICGHSLGGAVAAILAAKLKTRGYRVTSLTTVAAPRFLKSPEDATIMRKLLPADHIRVEHDQDFVPFLPPSGSHVGNKLWLSNNGVHFVDTQQHLWTDSVWTNFRVWELLSVKGKPHRIPRYVKQLAELQ